MIRNYRRPIFLGVIVAAFGCGGVVQACGGTSDDSLTEAGMDATQSDSPAGDASPTDGMTPMDAPAESAPGCPAYNGANALCNSGVEHCNTCGSNLTACQIANYSTICEGLGMNIYSQAADNAILACAKTCDTDAASSCERAAIADASLTSPQQKLATDYCAKCSDASTCIGQVGANVVVYSDSLVQKIDQQCTPDSGTGCLTYAACAAAVEAAELKKIDVCDGG